MTGPTYEAYTFATNASGGAQGGSSYDGKMYRDVLVVSVEGVPRSFFVGLKENKREDQRA